MFETLFTILMTFLRNVGRDSVMEVPEHIDNAIQHFIELIERSNDQAVKAYIDNAALVRKDHDKQVHELLVTICLANPRVYDWAGSQKITAIKALRNIVGFQNASLKQAKDAVEDQRVYNKWATQHTVSTDPELADHNSNYQQGMTRECSE